MIKKVLFIVLSFSLLFIGGLYAFSPSYEDNDSPVINLLILDKVNGSTTPITLYSSSGLTLIYNPVNGVFTLNGNFTASNYLPVKLISYHNYLEPGVYNYSYYYVSGSMSGNNPTLKFWNGDWSFYPFGGSLNNKTDINYNLTIVDDRVKFMEFFFEPTASYNNFQFKLQLTKGSEVKPYQVPLNIPNIYSSDGLETGKGALVDLDYSDNYNNNNDGRYWLGGVKSTNFYGVRYYDDVGTFSVNFGFTDDNLGFMYEFNLVYSFEYMALDINDKIYFLGSGKIEFKLTYNSISFRDFEGNLFNFSTNSLIKNEQSDSYFHIFFSKTPLFEYSINDPYGDGYNDGHQDGYYIGKIDGYNDGRQDGYQSGKTDGYNDGYQKGLIDGNDLNIGLVGFMPGILGAVFAFFFQISSISFLGISLLDIFAIIFALFVIGLVFKFIF